MILPLLPPADPDAALGRAVLATDWWRARPGIEWMHFVVVGDGVRLVANFSLREEAGVLRPRLLTLWFEGGRWAGDVEEHALADVEVRPGRIDAFFGESHVRFADGCYRLRLRPRASPVHAEVRLRPVAAPLLATNLRLPSKARFHWTSVPRLYVEEGTVGGRSLAGCTAYHDHNWGSFDLGDDVAWEWAFGLPVDDADPWSVMALRVSDRARHRTLTQGIAVWRDGRLWREFRDAEVAFAREGRAWQERTHRVPAALDLVPAAGGAAPRGCVWRGAAGEDVLDVAVRNEGHAQLLVPVGRRVVTLCELAAAMRVTGTLRGRRVDAELVGMLEVLDG